MKTNRAILQITMEQMPYTFTSQQFNRQAIKNGMPPLRIKHKGLSEFISKYAVNEFKGAKTWHKKNIKINAVGDEEVIKYFKALQELKMILDYTNKLSMNEFSMKHEISIKTSIILQKGGIIKKLKNGRYPEWEWVSIEPTREMAIKTIEELSKLNPVIKKEKEPQIKYDIVSEVNGMKPTGSKKDFISKLASLALIKHGKNNILNEIKEWQENGQITKKQAFDLRAAIGLLDITNTKEIQKQKQPLIDYYKIKLFFGLITIRIKVYYK